MSVHNHDHDHETPSAFSRARLVMFGFLIITGALLFSEHSAHALGYLIWLPLLACPLMHLFMHGKHGHGGHGDQGARSTSRDGDKQ